MTEEQIKKQAEENIKNLAIETAKAEVEEAKKGLAVKSEVDKQIAELSAEVKKQSQISKKETQDITLDGAIKNAIKDNAEGLKNLNGKMSLALKAAATITTASWATGALGRQTTDVRRDLYNSPYNPFYLRNIFPNIATESDSITIPQVSKYEGAVALWERGKGTAGADTDKPLVEPQFKDVTVQMKWLAGIARVNRELLMNVAYLQGAITNTLLYSKAGLYAAENLLITNYLSTNATAYAGSKTKGVEQIIDAAFNQMLGQYIIPTHVLMNPADYLTFIKFNKATGSGEYDLPNNTLNVVNASGLEVSLQVVPVPTLTPGDAFVIGANEFEFITRLQPELRVSEDDADNFTKNKITFRVEEMVGFIAKDLNAVVKVELAEETAGDEEEG